MEINSRIESVIEKYSGFSSWEDKYREIIQSGKKMEPLLKEEKVESNKVKGCQSQVWLSAKLEGEKIIFKADSDASITKGIISLLVYVYSDSTPDEILNTKPDFIDTIGLRQHLSMSRANGLNSMLKQISMYALAFKTKLSMGGM